MHIVGTAGHVDHGKSSLVRALTGTNPDRWIEEQLRGMTLDLGFAHLRFDDGVEAGIVDVPGHERFLHNMLAGAAGMEVLLLVVAANEGPRPQTLEHLAVLRHLNVRRTIVALTKADLLDASELAFAAELTTETLSGTLAANAPIVPVSTLTGVGLEQLKAVLHDALAGLAPRAPEAPAYLPIDRVFAVAGHGTVVTGTLMQGRVRVGDSLAITPLDRDVRVRGLHVFGQAQTSVAGGARVAINIPGVEVHEIARGAVLASRQFESRRDASVTFRAEASALAILRRRVPVRAYIGSAELLGTLVFATVPTTTEAVSAQLHLRSSTVIVPGAAYVVRRLSPKTLLGGGTIGAPTSASSDELTAAPENRDRLAIRNVLRGAGLAGLSASKIGAAANVREDVAVTHLAELVDDGHALRLAKPAAFVDANIAGDLLMRVRDVLRAGERDAPWLLGRTSLGLARELAVDEAQLVRILLAFVEHGELAYRAGYFSSLAFAPELRAEQRAFFDAAFKSASERAPVSYADLLVAMKATKIAGLAGALDTLLGTGVLVRVGDAVYRGLDLAAIRASLEATLRRETSITMAGFRDLIGTSRKYAVPLLEWFDAAGVTIRSGDLRTLRNASARADRAGSSTGS